MTDREIAAAALLGSVLQIWSCEHKDVQLEWCLYCGARRDAAGWAFPRWLAQAEGEARAVLPFNDIALLIERDRQEREAAKGKAVPNV